jgi:hypothetical protein
LSGLGCGLSGSVGRFGLRRVILRLRLLSMDQIMPLNLPRYMFRRANGSFRYKRNVPKDLRTVIPMATVYRQLGNTYQDALWALPKVHAEIEALFDLERRTTDEQRARELVRERLGERHKSMFIEGAVDPEWPEFDDFQELAEDVEHAVPRSGKSLIRSGCLRTWCSEWAAYWAVSKGTGLALQQHPRPTSHRGGLGGAMTACIFLGREEESSWCGHRCQSQLTQAKDQN